MRVHLAREKSLGLNFSQLAKLKGNKFKMLLAQILRLNILMLLHCVREDLSGSVLFKIPTGYTCNRRAGVI